eukprot:m.103359 g.103359  ORF g.103359 m.103359 type:complete len:411 (-) comp51570_c0_seq1:31-1263(-)
MPMLSSSGAVALVVGSLLVGWLAATAYITGAPALPHASRRTLLSTSAELEELQLALDKVRSAFRQNEIKLRSCEGERDILRKHSHITSSSSENPLAITPLLKPYTCSITPGVVVEIALRQSFITADPQPVRWVMYIHPAQTDIYVSATISSSNQGNSMYEMEFKSVLYESIRAVGKTYPRPVDPIFLDVGANIGVHSLFFAALGIRTHSFEPMPGNNKLLQCSAAASPKMAEKFNLNLFGLSDKASDGGCMKVLPGNQGSAFVDTSGVGCDSTGIKMRTMDEYWNDVLNREHVFMIKMDIQGFEYFAINGGETMLRTKPPPFFFFEFSPPQYAKHGQDSLKLLQHMHSLGYDISHDNLDGIFKPIEPTDYHKLLGAVELNLRLVHEGVLDQFRKDLIAFSPFDACLCKAG